MSGSPQLAGNIRTSHVFDAAGNVQYGEPGRAWSGSGHYKLPSSEGWLVTANHHVQRVHLWLRPEEGRGQEAGRSSCQDSLARLTRGESPHTCCPISSSDQIYRSNQVGFKPSKLPQFFCQRGQDKLTENIRSPIVDWLPFKRTLNHPLSFSV